MKKKFKEVFCVEVSEPAKWVRNGQEGTEVEGYGIGLRHGQEGALCERELWVGGGSLLLPGEEDMGCNFSPFGLSRT